MSCNPDPDHKLRELIDWHLDEEGYPIQERDGVVRYFIRRDGDFIWGETEEELKAKYGENCRPLSFTFVSATIHDNPVMKETNPDYLAFLEGLDPVNRAQLLDGNWNVRAEGNNYFRRENLVQVDKVPPNIAWARGWDLASQEVTAQNKNCDFTTGIKLGKDSHGFYYLVGDYHESNFDNDLQMYGRFRKRPGERDRIISDQGHYDGVDCIIVLPVDPGAAGKVAYQELAKRLMADGLRVKPDPTPHNKDKLTRFTPFADAVEAGLVRVIKSSFPPGAYNDLCTELEKFDGERSTTTRRDDRADAVATAFNYLTQKRNIKIIPRNQRREYTLAAERLSEKP